MTNDEYIEIQKKLDRAIRFEKLIKNSDFILYTDFLKDKVFDSLDPTLGQPQFDFLFGVKSAINCVQEEIKRIPEYKECLKSPQKCEEELANE